ncbi:hypothetical protein [Verrucomicrobium spinosum]|uniref:hypothetical protein n=1 Tax=Verrucomicrobium spinosum TaxID=2736 RepID=UPI0001746B3E|nr:hypothetical protein [Verrucomicrobium spinosum]
MSTQVYLSRNFTEFGAFTVAEILDFKKRGIVLDGDFIREDGSSAWVPSLNFLSSLPEPKPTTLKAAPKAKAVKEAKPVKEPKPAAKTPAKKASKKASTPAN